MKKINQQMKTTFIFSTHDRRVVDMADRLVQMEDGRIRAFGVRRDGDWIMAPERHADDDDKGDEK